MPPREQDRRTDYTNPALVELKLMTRDNVPVARFERDARTIAVEHLRCAPMLVDDFITGAVTVF